MTVDHIFIASVHEAVRTMRTAGLNDALIACVLGEVRAAAITEERLRVSKLMRANPPYHPPWGELEDLLK